MPNKRILVVENEPDMQLFYKESLEGLAEVVPALTIEEARIALAASTDFDAILMDACVPGAIINTADLVEEIRKHFFFTGPIIASSSMAHYRAELMEAGCDHQSEKETAHEKACQLLGIKYR